MVVVVRGMDATLLTAIAGTQAAYLTYMSAGHFLLYVRGSGLRRGKVEPTEISDGSAIARTSVRRQCAIVEKY